VRLPQRLRSWVHPANRTTSCEGNPHTRPTTSSTSWPLIWEFQADTNSRPCVAWWRGKSTGNERHALSESDELRKHSSFEMHTVGFQEFMPSPDCVREVRPFVKHTLEEAGIDQDATFECQLVADELAANAVRHAGSIFSVAIELTDATVRIAVRDESNALPEQHDTTPDASNGRGLVIVSGTAYGWGSVPLGRGKEIWADVTRPPG
jgi:serine/threonine-protein kinase RsbW